jgi:SAM-dependent methyltransferase
MNNRIFRLISENLKDSFNLPKYDSVRDTLSKDTRVDQLPWTPVRFEKFKDKILNELGLDSTFEGTVAEITNALDTQYMARFFGEIWRPNTDVYMYSGWVLADEINQQNPKAVLDVGCGYNQFKNRINNLVGIDPFNNCADFMVDILDYNVPDRYDHIMALGSINFGTLDDIEIRLKKCIDLLADGGKIYVRANPGHPWKNGPWVDIFPWSFEVAHSLAQKHNLKLLTFKKDNNDRLYFVYQK